MSYTKYTNPMKSMYGTSGPATGTPVAYVFFLNRNVESETLSETVVTATTQLATRCPCNSSAISEYDKCLRPCSSYTIRVRGSCYMSW